MESFRAYPDWLRSRRVVRFSRMGVAALALFGILAASGCGHSSSNPADKDRPAPPPADAEAQIQNSAQLTPQQKQLAINAITAARTRASGQMGIGPKKVAGM